MANWTSGILTNRGRDLQLKVEAGEKLKMTRFKLGDGMETTAEAADLNDLMGAKIAFGITGIERLGTLCKFTGVVTSTSVSAGFRAREWGLFAEDPDLGEILYMIALDDRPDYIAAQDAVLNSTITYALNVDISQASKIEPVIDPQGLVTTEILEKAAGLVKRNTGYSLNDKAFDIQLSAHPSWRLVCTKAGTTSGVLLNLHGAKLGDIYTDGTAEWTVKDAYEAAVDAHNKAPDAHADLRALIANAGIAILQRSRSYQVGDIAYHKALPSWARLECVRAGTTGATLPTQIEQMVQNGGVMVTDGTVVWIIDDLRDGTPVGAVRGSLYLPAGYVKANGATVQRADYPRLVALADRYHLWTDDVTANAGLFGRGDGAASMVLPNWTDRMMQFTAEGVGAAIEAGLPNIKGEIYGKFSKSVYPGSLFSLLISYDNRSASVQSSAGWYEGKAGFDASRSNPIYGKSNTVQPAAIKLIPIIRY